MCSRTGTVLTLTAYINHFFSAADAAAGCAAKRFAECSCDDIYLAENAFHLMRAAAGLAEKTRRVRVVNHDHRVILLAESDNLIERSISPSIEKTPSVAIILNRCTCAS